MNSNRVPERSVGHFRRTYLPATETFIYNYVSNHETYDPFVAGVHSENLDKFPFEPRHLFMEQSRLSPRFWIYGALAKLDILDISRTHYRDVIQRTDPDVLHAHFGPEGIMLRRHRSPDRPLVTSFYGADASWLVKHDTSIQSQYRSLFETGDLFLVEGPSMKKKLLHLGCPEEKTALQRIAIDTDRIAVSPPDSDGSWRVLMVGRFVEKKGFPDGIRAFGEVFDDVPDAELRIVGGEGESEGLSRSSLAQMATDKGIEDKVIFLGYLNYEEYLAEMSECDILLAPSKTAESGDSEGGAPTVLLEAQASGKPIVATTHADVPYVVEDGKAGKLAEPGNVDQLAAMIQWFLDNPDQLSEMGERGRENVVQHHDVGVLVNTLEKRYDSIVV